MTLNDVELLSAGSAHKVVRASIVAMLAIFAPAEAVYAENTSANDESPTHCITLHTIKQTKVLDDQNVIFYTNGNRNYKNHLPYPCSGLGVADSFMYRTSESRLCNVDIITVLEKMGGGFTPGASCGLGNFELLDQQQLDELTHKPSKK